MQAIDGGNDPGAVNGSRYESNDNLRMAMAVKSLLEANGHTVKLSRETDITQSISSITAAANAWGADYFLDLHRNAATAAATGIECLIRSNSSATSRKLAEAVLKRLVAVGGTNRGIKVQDTNTASLNQTKMPGCIVELLFISNPNDNVLFDGKFNEYANAIANGICDLAGRSATASVTVASTDGWKKENNNWYYYTNLGKATGWQLLDWNGKTDWYYLDGSGVMQAGKWVTSNSRDYYLTKSGAMAANIHVLSADGVKIYWVGSDGAWDGKTINLAV